MLQMAHKQVRFLQVAYLMLRTYPYAADEAAMVAATAALHGPPSVEARM
jgi:hypothetical protein